MTEPLPAWTLTVPSMPLADLCKIISAWFEFDVTPWADVLELPEDASPEDAALLLLTLCGAPSAGDAVEIGSRLAALPLREISDLDDGACLPGFPALDKWPLLGEALSLEIERPGSFDYRQIGIGKDGAFIDALWERCDVPKRTRLWFFNDERVTPETCRLIPAELLQHLNTGTRIMRH